MFLSGKYSPESVSDFSFNNEIFSQLAHIASYEDIPHIIISGPSGGGKKTLLKFFLRELYDESVDNLQKNEYTIAGSSSKKQVEIMQSDHHIVIEPTNTNHDKYILQDIIRKYTTHKQFDIFKTNRKFKTIVIYNLENLSGNSQAALRRTMEKYAKICRFVMICNNLSKIFDPLKSRCRVFCVPLPSDREISRIITKICNDENIPISKKKTQFLLDASDGNLKKAIWMINSKLIIDQMTITLDEVFTAVVNLIMRVNANDILKKGDRPNPAMNIISIFNNKIRSNIYSILITNIKGTEIILTLMTMLIKTVKNDAISLEIIKVASETEYNLIHGRREIAHIDYFVFAVMRLLRKYRNTLV